MIAYKGFKPGLICLGYQFVMGLNKTENAVKMVFIVQKILWIVLLIIPI